MTKEVGITIEEVEIVCSGVKKTVSLLFVEEGGVLAKDLTKYFVVDAFGRTVYIKTNNRILAQDVVDAWFGANKYTVRCSGLEKIKGEVNVRATEYRRGQAQQRLKAKILNG